MFFSSTSLTSATSALRASADRAPALDPLMTMSGLGTFSTAHLGVVVAYQVESHVVAQTLGNVE
ncbi:hypothetical protein PF001_g3770 [Phytophthora fragariae]|uniref:Uncharacterized protein n=1 Tax=Phytophthora fragariae TaxID=53985 RepID=A0A6A4EJD6_9STRA|nr:hypothetical protein PF001_g3770 [Phytophthora fragariae]